MPASRSLSVGDLEGYLDEWRTYLEAENKAPRTIQSYLEAAHQLIAWVREQGYPAKADEIRAIHVQEFLASVIDTHSASTAANRYRSLRQLFRYLADLCREDPDEPGIIPHSPMASMRPPKVGKQVIPAISKYLRARETFVALTGSASEDFTCRLASP